MPRSFDRTLAIVVRDSALPRLTSHGLRHTAATHMVQSSADLGELRAVADVLGHSPEILLRVYAHAAGQPPNPALSAAPTGPTLERASRAVRRVPTVAKKPGITGIPVQPIPPDDASAAHSLPSWVGPCSQDLKKLVDKVVA